MKRVQSLIAVVFAIFLILLLSVVKNGKGGEDMYIAIYDRELKHITNITNAKYDITKRVFDFDTSTFEGKAEMDVTDNGFIFILCEANGKQVYSGFMQNIKQDANKVTFKGGDFKTIFDTEIVLDYTIAPGSAPLQLCHVFRDVVNVVANELEGIMEYTFSYEEPQDYIDWIANYDTQYLIVNANNFLKPYLAYYQYRIKASFNTSTKTIHCDIVKNDETIAIKLKDFIHESTRTDVTINKAIATLKFDNVEPTGKGWITSTEEYWTKATDKGEIIQAFPEPMDNAENYNYGYALKILVSEQGAPDTYPVYFQVSNSVVVRPSDIPKKSYYLGRDNLIYEEIIPLEKRILPVKAKVFEDGFFQKAQFNAISELVNNRYNENIIITNTQTPIDLRELELYTMIEVYDKTGKVVIMPVAEISLSNDNYTIKLGFKKTLFTEIVKSKSQEAIKNTNSGASGGTTVVEDPSTVYSVTEPIGTQDGSFWIKPEEIIEEE